MKRFFLYIILLGSVVCGTAQAQVLTGYNSTEQWFQEGLNYYRQGSYAAAKQTLQRFLNKSPKSQNSEEAYYMLACCSYELKEPGRIVILQRFLRNYPSSRYRYRIWALIGSAYYFEGDYEKAVQSFEKCKWDYLNDSEVQDILFRRSLALMEVGKMEEAESSFKELQKRGTQYAVDCTYYLSYLAYKRGELKESLEGFLSLLKNDRYGKWSSCYAGDIYLKTKQYKKAIEIADQSITSSSEKGVWFLELERVKGEALFHLERYQEAIAPLKDYIAAAEAPSREAIYALGVSYLQSGAYSLSVEQLLRIIKSQDALSQNAWLQLGRAYIKMNEREQAKKAFAQAALMQYEASVREEAAYNYALTVYEDPQSDFTQRVGAFEKFLTDYPNSYYKSKATVYLSEIYLNSKNYEAALRSIEKIASPDKQILETKKKLLFQLGTEALKREEYATAISYLNRSLELTGMDTQTTADTYYWRGEAYYRSGKPQLAEKDFQKYLSMTLQKESETYPLAYYNLGYIAFNVKNYARANTFFTQFLNLIGETNSKLRADAYNRLGDCYYHVRNFEEAKGYYDKVMGTDPSVADYALYQNAFMAGLQKDYSLKITLLERMLNTYPQSSYAAPALYEKGRAYVMLGKNSEAIRVYTELVSKYPQADVARKGAGEIGLLYYQTDCYPEAIAAYKKVIEIYPGTEEATQSMKDLKSIYIETNRINDFVDYASKISGGGTWINPAEQDSLLYESAERFYQQGDRAQALKSLEEYVRQFPKGSFVQNAQCYLIDLYAQSGANEKAFVLYEQVEPQVKDKEMLETLQMSILDVAYKQKNNTLILRIAESNPRESGAKAHYLSNELLYGEGKYLQVEKQILDFIDRGSQYGYWMARHFILLSDTYVKLGRKSEARQYLQSLKENYKVKDDIQDRIATRLKALK